MKLPVNMKNRSAPDLPAPVRLFLNGSFTVEASLIMTLLLPVLLSILYLGFCDHDRGILMGSACEITATADNMQWKSNPGKGLDKKASLLAKNHILCTRDLKTHVSVSEDSVQVSYTGSVSLPGILPHFFGKERVNTDQKRERRLLHPSDTIRKIRGLEYMTDELQHAGDPPASETAGSETAGQKAAGPEAVGPKSAAAGSRTDAADNPYAAQYPTSTIGDYSRHDFNYQFSPLH